MATHFNFRTRSTTTKGKLMAKQTTFAKQTTRAKQTTSAKKKQGAKKTISPRVTGSSASPGQNVLRGNHEEKFHIRILKLTKHAADNPPLIFSWKCAQAFVNTIKVAYSADGGGDAVPWNHTEPHACLVLFQRLLPLQYDLSGLTDTRGRNISSEYGRGPSDSRRDRLLRALFLLRAGRLLRAGCLLREGCLLRHQLSFRRGASGAKVEVSSHCAARMDLPVMWLMQSRG